MDGKVKLVSRKYHKFAGKIVKPDDLIWATPREARTLIGLGWAVEAPKLKPAVLQSLPPAPPKDDKGKRDYKRRDLTAKDADEKL